MGCIRKGLKVLAILVLVLVVAVAAAGTWFVRRPWPQVDGSVSVPGLSAPVEVLRDKWGVPHIYGQTEADVVLAQGYVHAQDRLWQMEFNRRVGSGTLSAILGESTLDIDRFMRTLGLRRSAQKDLEELDAQTLALLDAYSSGVNAYVEAHRSRLPLEFTILGVDPEPWTPLDSVTWGKVMAFNLGHNYTFELLRAQIFAELGEEAMAQLVPPYPGAGPVIVPPEALGYGWLQDKSPGRTEDLLGLVSPSRSDWGSNNWVVHGSRTTTGRPLLAGDTHLGLDMPSVWYEVGLHGGAVDVVGFSFPGAPLVIIGHNRDIAWAVTNLPADVQDLYIERLDDPATPRRYEFMGSWRDLQSASEVIDVKGQPPVHLQVLSTHHGPLINEAFGLEDSEPMALRWTALDAMRLFHAAALLDRAANWDEFREALRSWDTPSQNFVYADVQGNIGYQAPGRLPVRESRHQGTVPVPGWTGEYEWQGFVPFDELPSAFNPSAGFLVSANNKVVPDEYPFALGFDWSAPYRAQRIADLLSADPQVSIADMQSIQAETYSLPAEALRPYLSAVEPADSREQEALQLVSAWDLRMEADRAGASIYQVWYWRLVQDTLGDEMGDDLLASYLDFATVHVPMMVDLMKQPDSPWFNDRTTAGVETRDDIVRRSFGEAVAWLVETLGGKPSGWRWGRLHTKTFVHQPLGLSGIGPIEALFSGGPIAARGDSFTVDAAWFDYPEPFAMTGGASQREIVDLGAFDSSLACHTTGQSGHLFHPHREDLVHMWQAVEYHPLLFGRAAVEAAATNVLTLK